MSINRGPELPGPDFGNGRKETDEAYRFRYQEGGSGAMLEMLRRTYNPELFLYAVRKSVAGQEALIAQGQELDQWTLRNLRDTVDGRIHALSLEQYPDLVKRLGLKEFGMGGKEGQVTKETALAVLPIARQTKDELFARWTVLEALSKQMKMSADVGTYAKDYFLATWATWPEARHYSIIGNLSATPLIPERDPEKEEVVKFGTLVDEALRGWVAIAEQEPIRKGEDKPPIKNLFAQEAFQDRIDAAMNWVISRLEVKSGYQLPDDESERQVSLGYQELAEAANLALILFRQLDMDVKYCWRAKEDDSAAKAKNLTDMLNQVGDALDLYKLEIGPLAKDSAKLTWWVLRSLAEAGRDYPASIGLPLLVGKFPNLSTDFMRMTRVKREVDRKKEIKKIEEEKGGPLSETEKKEVKGGTQLISLYNLWRERGVEFGDLPWDILEWKDGITILDQALGKKDSEDTERQWKIPEGIAKQAFKIPYFLEIFYAYSKIYTVLTEADVSKTWAILNNPGELRKLNKAWSLVFSMVCGELLPTSGTTRRVMQLAKCNLTGASIVAQSRYGRLGKIPFHKSETLHKGPIVPFSKTIRKDDEPGYIAEQMTRARQAGFLTLPVEERFGDKDWLTKEELAELEDATIRFIIKNKRALLPHEACQIKTREGKSWFKDKELEAIAQSDLYAPFGAMISPKKEKHSN